MGAGIGWWSDCLTSQADAPASTRPWALARSNLKNNADRALPPPRAKRQPPLGPGLHANWAEFAHAGRERHTPEQHRGDGYGGGHAAESGAQVACGEQEGEGGTLHAAENGEHASVPATKPRQPRHGVRERRAEDVEPPNRQQQLRRCGRQGGCDHGAPRTSKARCDQRGECGPSSGGHGAHRGKSTVGDEANEDWAEDHLHRGQRHG
mmetsp:Transcript_25785/g.65416  ORF Transcript_25785/g.65416 Transcript_25785/m.65416 type:complete len:208 (-) Transcript_25785:763-1386(-)